VVKRYKAVLFDLFGTVALFHQDKLPLFEWQGKTSRSTMGGLRAVIEKKIPGVSFERFFAALSEVSRELGEVRTREMREFPSRQRFALTLARIGFPESDETRQIAEELSLAHMALLAAATDVPSSHSDVLHRTGKHYDIALVSNFDHGPTARFVLQKGGIVDHFHQVVISDEHGWRKPHPRIFTDTLSLLKVEPQEALFVGDSPVDDIVGAKGVGMDIAWVNALGADVPAGIPAPDYMVHAIPELLPLLFPDDA
jgi:putative hydrolase of the HAD superfamily